MNEATKNTVIELFERHRKVPGEKFDPDFFFDFLISKPKGKGKFRNSFLALRRFNAFWDEVQLKFGVCFSIKDRESDYSLNRFCERIEQLQQSKNASKASLRNREKESFEWNIFILLNLILVVLAIALNEVFWAATGLWFGVAILNYKLVSSYLEEKRYISRLGAKIDSAC